MSFLNCHSNFSSSFFVNSCYWGVGLEAKIPERSVVDLVGTYEPSMFGFGTHRKGVLPAAHAGLE